ncbi:hypothetical protein ABPG74_000942 [Tetrahymena malaccensis]
MRNILQLRSKFGSVKQQQYQLNSNIVSLKIQETPLLDQQLRSKLIKTQDFKTNKYPFYFKNNLLNPDSTLYKISGNGFFDAFYAAYCLHGDVMISASDIWLAICHKFSRQVLRDPERYRKIFVSHDGKMSLSFYIDPNSQDWKGFPSRNNRWDKAVECYYNQISQNIKQDLETLMKNDFSSSNQIEQISAQMIFISSMSEYFRYSMNCICGIQNIHFIGKIEDYEHLANKIESLMSYFPAFEIQAALDVVNKFIHQMKNPNQIDVNFWNSIFQKRKQDIYYSKGCTSENREKQIFDGWFMSFFDNKLTNEYYNLEWVQDDSQNVVPNFSSQFVVEANNLGVKHQLTFETGMKGIEEVHPNTFRPNIYIQIY